jgi:hypothetical protein
MQTESFKASVQYGDWKGTSAADGADKKDANDWLVKNGHKQEGEFLLGITMLAGENHGVHEDPIYVEFLLATPGDHDNIKQLIDTSKAPILVKKVKVEMSLVEFFGLFKRFSINFSSHGMLDGHEYTYMDY